MSSDHGTISCQTRSACVLMYLLVHGVSLIWPLASSAAAEIQNHPSPEGRDRIAEFNPPRRAAPNSAESTAQSTCQPWPKSRGPVQ
ncbi:hypothetical protein V8C35DRAFT_315150 [Trichoderma chlorosporum]